VSTTVKLRSRARALAGVRARGLVSRRVAQEVERRETDGCPLRARAACQQCTAHGTINTGVKCKISIALDRPAAAPTRPHGSTSASLLAREHVSPKLDLIAGVTDPESFPLAT
jgi:hypothetical protein